MSTPTDISQLVYVAQDAQQVAQAELNIDYGIQRQVDEVSLLFQWGHELDRFVNAAKYLGLEHFNSVPSDTMIRTGVSEGFIVRFEFLRIPKVDWRIEAMQIIAGLAPLHRERLRKSGAGCVVHASFKCEDVQDYADAKAQLRQRRVHFETRLESAAEYSNSYGIFSYWQSERGSLLQRPYFKPRVNLRDTLPVAQPSVL